MRGSHTIPFPPEAQAIAVMLVGSVASAMMMQYPLLPALAVGAFTIAIVAVVLRSRGSATERDRRWRQWGLARAALGARVYPMLGAATILLPGTLTVLMDRLEGGQPTRANSPGLLTGEFPLSRLVTIVVFVPLVEELAFRGLLLLSLKRRVGSVTAVLVSAGAFAAIHGSWHRSPYYIVLGLVLGCVAVRANSIWPSYAMHVTFNAATAVLNRLFATRMISSAGSTSTAVPVPRSSYWRSFWRRSPGNCARTRLRQLRSLLACRSLQDELDFHRRATVHGGAVADERRTARPPPVTVRLDNSAARGVHIEREPRDA